LNQFSSPTYLPIDINLAKNRVSIAKLEESDYQKSIFILSRGQGKGSLHFQDIQNLELSSFLADNANEIKEPYFIFHHGFCCSTLISRLIEARFQTLSLREPPVINWATSFKKNTYPWTEDNEIIFRKIIDIHGRTFRSQQRAIIKCSDYVTYCLSDFIRPTTKTIFLYSDLSEYLGSCSKEKRDQWIANRGDFSTMKEYLGYQKCLDLDDTPTQATLYWCFQIAKFLENPYSENARSLNMNRIFSEKNLIKSLGNFFGLKEKYIFFRNRKQKTIRSSYSKTGDYEFSYSHRKKIISDTLKEKQIQTKWFENLALEILGEKLNKLESMKL